jgi:hypothetical protein
VSPTIALIFFFFFFFVLVLFSLAVVSGVAQPASEGNYQAPFPSPFGAADYQAPPALGRTRDFFAGSPFAAPAEDDRILAMHMAPSPFDYAPLLLLQGLPSATCLLRAEQLLLLLRARPVLRALEEPCLEADPNKNSNRH